VGRVLELRGTVAGSVQTGEGLMIILNQTNQNSICLDIPQSEADVVQELSAPSIRALVRVEPGASGNVVPLKVLCVAPESMVQAIETHAIRVATRAAKEAELRRKAGQLATARTMLPSRGNTGLPRQTPDSPEYQTLNAYYAPYLGWRAKPLFLPYLRYIANHNRKLSPQQAAQITASLLHFADRYDVDPRLVVAMVIAESDFRPETTSRAGAMGLGQLMPYTAKALGVNNPYDPVENLRGSIQYLRSRLDTFRDKALPDGGMSFEQITLAMAAYNAGVGAVKKHGGVPPYRETQAYVRRVITLYEQLCQ
jgi:soluble lytic murein transglycosylase-like protein